MTGHHIQFSHVQIYSAGYSYPGQSAAFGNNAAFNPFGQSGNPMVQGFQMGMMMGMLMGMYNMFMYLFQLLQSMMGFANPNNNFGMNNGGNNTFGNPFGGFANPRQPSAPNFSGGFPNSPPSGPFLADPNAPPDQRRMAALNWARSQLGVSEQNNPNAVRGYSRGAWQPWCADFVSTALNRAGGSPWGHRSAVRDILGWAQRNGRVTNRPQVGDAIVFRTSRGPASHIGLVERINPDGTITTIEGNTSDAVRRRTYRLNDGRIQAFVKTA
jgi:hypothetical protein